MIITKTTLFLVFLLTAIFSHKLSHEKSQISYVSSRRGRKNTRGYYSLFLIVFGAISLATAIMFSKVIENTIQSATIVAVSIAYFMLALQHSVVLLYKMQWKYAWSYLKNDYANVNDRLYLKFHRNMGVILALVVLTTFI